MRGAAPIDESASALFLKARQTLVADAPADAEACAQLGHCEAVAPRALNETQGFVHGCSLQSGHRRPR